MGATRTAVARARARTGVLGSVAAVVLLLTALATGVVDSLTSAGLSGLRDGLAAASGVDGAARWQIRIASDAEEQADAAASVLDRMLTPHGATWSRSVQTAPVDAVHDDDSLGVVLLADDGVPERAELASGAWPDASDAVAAAAAVDALPTTLHAGAADSLGLAIDDVVELQGRDGPRRLLVVGTWTPTDPSDPRWFGEPIIATGGVEGGAGPFLAPEQAVADLPAATIVRWTAVTDAASMTPERAADLRAAIPNVEPALRADAAIGTDGLGALGRLTATLDRLLAGLGAVRAIAPLPLLLLAFAGFAAIDRLAALLSASRRGETVLLRARGASAGRLARDTAVEILAVGVPAAVLGAGTAEALLSILRPGEPRAFDIAALVASAALVGALALVVGRAWRDATRPVVRAAGDEVGRMPRAAAAGGVILVVVAAAVALWQFRLYGSPLVASAAGTPEVDPIAVLAPVLVLLALCLLALGLSRPIGVLLEGGASRWPGLVPALPMRQLARRAGLYASASLVTMLAVSGLTLAAAFAGSWQAFDDDAAAAEVGGDVRVAFAGGDLVRDDETLSGADRFATLEGVAASAPVFRGEVRIGSDPAMLVALPTAILTAIAPGSDVGTAVDDLVASQDAAAPELPPGAAAVEIDVTLDAPAGTPGTVAVSAWVLGPDGAAARIPAGTFAVSSDGGTARAELPGTAGLGLLGFDAALTGSQGVADVVAGFGEVTIDGDAAASEALETVGEVTLSATRPSGRVATTAVSDGAPVPVILGAGLAGSINAEPGDPLAFRVLTGGADIDAVVAGVTPVVPGGGDTAILADLGAVSAAAFAGDSGVAEPTEQWLAASDPAAVAATIERDRATALTATTRADASSAPLIAPAVAALWVGAFGALLFALVAVIALVAALGRARFGEVIVLRALGMPAALQARARFAELAPALASATLIGIVVGALTAFATVRELARASVASAADGLPIRVHVDWLPWAVALVVFLAAAAAIGAGAAASVQRIATRPGVREEER